MLDALMSGEEPGNIMPGPPFPEFRARLMKLADETFNVRITAIAGAVCTEHGKHDGCELMPIHKKPPVGRIGEDEVHDVARIAFEQAIIAEDCDRGCVPR